MSIVPAPRVEEEDDLGEDEGGGPQGPSARCRRFTPAEAVIDRGLCLARTWADGRGGQCHRHPHPGQFFCRLHLTGGTGQEQWRVFGHVDGPIPEDKLRDFEKNADNRSGEKVDLSFWKRRRLLSRSDALSLEVRTLSKFIKDAGYTGEKWRSNADRLIRDPGFKPDVVEALMREQASDLFSEVLRIQRAEGEARARTV